MPPPNTPVITVIIPAWNLGAELKTAAASVKSQGVNASILVIDNASDTPLPRIAGAQSLRLPKRVTIGEARNSGLAKAKTPYIMFLDADDQLLPGTLRALLSSLENDPRAVLAAGRILDWNPVTNHRRAAPFPPRYVYTVARLRHAHALLNSMRYATIMIGSLLRTSAVSRFPNISYGEDWVSSVSLAFSGRMILQDRPSKLYRLDPSPKREPLGSNKKRLATPYRAAMKEVRHRIWSVGPTWAKLLLPIIFLAQYFFLLSKLWRSRKPRTA